MTKKDLKIKIEKCFAGSCSVKFDHGQYADWLDIICGTCVFPGEIDKLSEFLYVSNVSASVDYSVEPNLPFIEIRCKFDDILED